MQRASALVGLCAALLVASGCSTIKSKRNLVTDANRAMPSLPDRFAFHVTADAFKNDRFVASRHGKVFNIEWLSGGKLQNFSVEFFSQRHTSDNRPAFLLRLFTDEPKTKDPYDIYAGVEMLLPNKVVVFSGAPSGDEWTSLQQNDAIARLVSDGDLKRLDNGDMEANSANAIYTILYAMTYDPDIDKRTLTIVPLPAKTN